MTKTIFARLKRVVSFVVILLIFFFLLRSLIRDWSQIKWETIHVNFIYLAVSFIVLVPHFIFYSKGWQHIMRELGFPISLTQSSWMIATTQIAKYAPGRIWYMLGRVYVGKKENISGSSLGLSMVLETCLLLTSSATIFLIATLAARDYTLANVVICIIMLTMAVILMIPRVLMFLANTMLKLLGRPVISASISFFQIIKLNPYFWGLWLAQIVGFYILVSAVYQIRFADIAVLASAYTLSWITGFVVVFAPGGLGIREGTMTLYLSTIMPLPMAIAISLISRVWITLFEVIVFFIGLIIQKNAKKKITAD